MLSGRGDCKKKTTGASRFYFYNAIWRCKGGNQGQHPRRWVHLPCIILSNEQNKRNIRVNTISLGLIKNQMGIKVKKITNTKKKFVSIKDVIKKIKIILKNNRINKKNINIL